MYEDDLKIIEEVRFSFNLCWEKPALYFISTFSFKKIIMDINLSVFEFFISLLIWIRVSFRLAILYIFQEILSILFHYDRYK